ncbi:MAG: IgGFc-binding protein [Candidatus Bathyarchaeota archaeon]|nr:IgGFc-binding protein [Candidatus Bathyarchaeota archaeon]MDH5689548.1 IgGFc-binding protein [Candidatus Bathyarchaeota archaeon]
MVKTKLCAHTTVLCLLLSSMLFLSSAQNDVDQGGYTYYGYVPARLWYAEPAQLGHGTPTGENFTINPLWIAESALIGVIAYTDETEVSVYLLPGNQLVEDETINEMEKLFVRLPNGTFFKVHASKPVAVVFLGGNVGGKELDPNMNQAALINSLYPAVDGGYAGREFVFIAAQGLTGLQYRILALEESEVTVYKEDGSTLTSFTLEANEYRSLSLSAFKAYRVASTGNIMVQSFGRGRSMYVPSVEGTYSGTSFYTISLPGTDTWELAVAYGFQIIAAEEAKVTIYDVEFKRGILEFTVPAGRNVTVQPDSHEIFIESDKPISVAYVHHGLRGGGGGGGGWAYGAGLTYTGVGPDETAYVYAPVSTSQESYVFAYKDGTIVTIDGAPIQLDADQYIPLASGLHEVETTENVLIQIVHWPLFPEFQAIQNFGAVVPAIETLNVRETVELQPVVEEGAATMTYIYAAVAVVAIVAVAVVYFLKVRK